MPPSAICWVSCWLTPSRKTFESNSPGSISVGFCSRLRRTSHRTSPPRPMSPTAISAPTDSPPSCHTRMPSTSPPIPTTERAAPTTSMLRSPV